MKIKLFFVHPANYGNMMMVDSFVYYFREIARKEYGDDPEFVLDILDKNELDRVKDTVERETNICGEFLFNRKRRGVIGKLQKLIYIPYEICWNIKKYDACVILGGDCISQYYSKQVFISDMIKFWGIAKKNPSFAPGQTMGPFHGYAVWLVRHALKNCHIYTRDHDCFEYLDSMFQFQHLSESRDLAFLDIPFQNETAISKRIIDKYIGPKEYVTIVASGANRQYTTDTLQYIEEYKRIICNTIDRTGYDILLLAHAIHTDDSNDKFIISQIYSRIPEEYKNRIHVVDNLILPYEARLLIGKGKYTITGRMHAAVSSINMGVVPICLSYSVKYKGVIGDVFDLNDYILQCRGNEMWQGTNVSDAIWNMQESLETNLQNIQDRIYHKLVCVKEMALGQIEDIAKQIYEGDN